MATAMAMAPAIAVGSIEGLTGARLGSETEESLTVLIGQIWTGCNRRARAIIAATQIPEALLDGDSPIPGRISTMKTQLLSLAGACVMALSLSAAAQAEDLTFTLKNNTGTTLTRFYSSPTGTNNWEEDVFGEQVLAPGESMDITIADGRTVCDYDMRFEFEDDTTTEDEQNLCELGSYTLHE